MAKRKDAVALFEVITAAKRREQAAAGNKTRVGPGGSMLRTPKWWFKTKTQDGNGQPPEGDGVPYAAPALPAPADATTVTYAVPGDPTSGYASAPAPGVVQRVAPPAPERVTIPERADGTAAFGLDAPADHASPARRPRRSWFGFGGVAKATEVKLDPDRREVTVKFRYTTAIIAGFAVCVIVGLAYVTGRQTNRANAGPGAVSSKAIKEGDVLAGVLDIQPEREASTDDNIAIDGGNDERSSSSNQPKVTPPSPDGSKNRSQPKSAPIVNEAAKPAPPRALPNGIEDGLPRAKGLNYVIIQIYPNDKGALGAADALKSAGIECTVEPAPPGWTADSDWKAVIGTLGFPPRSSGTPEYIKYKASIEAVSKSYAGKSKSKQFEPSLYRWR